MAGIGMDAPVVGGLLSGKRWSFLPLGRRMVPLVTLMPIEPKPQFSARCPCRGWLADQNRAMMVL